MQAVSIVHKDVRAKQSIFCSVITIIFGLLSISLSAQFYDEISLLNHKPMLKQ